MVLLYHQCRVVLSLEWTPQSHIPLEKEEHCLLHKSTGKHTVANDLQKYKRAVAVCYFTHPLTLKTFSVAFTHVQVLTA